MEAGEYVDDMVGTGETGDGVGAGAGSCEEGPGWATEYAESEIAGIAVVCCGDCEVEKIGAGAEEAVGWEAGADPVSGGAEAGDGIEAAGCVAMGPEGGTVETSGEAGTGEGAGSC